MIFKEDAIYDWLNLAQDYAEKNSDCIKVKVGSVIVNDFNSAVFGANTGIGYSCKENGCRRIMLYGEASKIHRLPSDCNSIHSEVNAIAKAARDGIHTDRATIFITRYPCEACARAIVSAGIKKVYYGREQDISEYTKIILESGGVRYYHVSDWNAPDTIL